MTGLDSLRRNARRVPKAAFWLMTPWRMPERLRFLRERAASQERARLLDDLIERERSRLEAGAQGNAAECMPGLDLCSDAALSEAAGLPSASVIGSSVDPQAVIDIWTAARFCMSLLRGRKDLYARFPYALSETADKNAFLLWLQSDDGAQDVGLTPVSQAYVAGLFSGDFAARARQAFMTEPRIRQVLPHGLTPAGQHSLFEWFMQHVWNEAEVHLRREEILWLFMQAAENPRAELARAYLFTPDWQQQFPDALTAFGWSGFASWFVRHYGADPQWVGVDVALEWYEPALQVRLGYGAQLAWQTKHPQALSDPGEALALLEWLASGKDASLSAAARRWCQALDVRAVVSALLKPGVNIIGHFCYPSGLRVSVESIAQALGQVGVDASLRDLRTDAKDDPHHVDFDGPEVHDVTVIHTQPEPFFPEAYVRADLAERSPRTYRIAYWYWEFDSIPDAWVDSAKQVDEVWTATEFIARGLRERLSVPVRTLFPGVRLTPFEVRKRSDFGLDEDRYTFLFTFHMMSVMERKNPLGLIRAFKAAFLEDDKVSLVLKTSFGYKQDVIERAQTLLANVQSVGAYSHSQGAPGIRNSVAKFIENRDGFPANPQDLFLTAGASSGVSTLLSVICNNESAGVLVPIPQYPLYTATLSLLNARCVPYLLEEEKAWGTDVTAILKSIEEAKAAAIDVRAVVVINPGNPTGASLSADDIKKVLDVAAEESLVVIADEVYQTNVFKGEFVSFKKRLRQLQKEEPGKYDDVELVSLHSISKGMVGECGHRGGYFELVGFDPLVQEQIYKLVSIGLCPPVVAQCLLECMVNPPVQGEPSYELYQKEYSGIAEGLHKRALSLYNAFQRMEGVEVQEPQVCLHTPYSPSLV